MPQDTIGEKIDFFLQKMCFVIIYLIMREGDDEENYYKSSAEFHTRPPLELLFVGISLHARLTAARTE